MTEMAWFAVTKRERALLLKALHALPENRRISALISKLIDCSEAPAVTIGVRGGQVEWVKGNPFPVRVLDYDNDRCDAPDMDDCGRPCWSSIEPTDRRRGSSRA